MADKPMPFSGEMVRAILDGRKTQTRRVIKSQPTLLNDRNFGFPVGQYNHAVNLKDNLWAFQTKCWRPHKNSAFRRVTSKPFKCPYQVGDRLWVRETWGDLDADHPRCKNGRKPKQGDRLVYRANPADDYQWGAGKPSQGSFCWRSSRFMPKWATRIWLEITGIRVERVQDISLEDCAADGGYTDGREDWRIQFMDLWDSLNAKHGDGWDKNPWVWCREFRRLNDG